MLITHCIYYLNNNSNYSFIFPISTVWLRHDPSPSAICGQQTKFEFRTGRLGIAIQFRLTFTLGPDVNFLTGHPGAHHVVCGHFYNVLISALQSRDRKGIILGQQLRDEPTLSGRVVRYGVSLQRSSPIVGGIPTHANAVGGSVLHDDLRCARWLHGNHLVLDLITAEQIVRRACIISGEAAFDACKG